MQTIICRECGGRMIHEPHTGLDLTPGTGNKPTAFALRSTAFIAFMKHSDIRILKILSLRGPNIWTYRPVLEAWVDIGELEECPSNLLPGFVERLCAWLPTLAEHRCSYGEPGGFVRRLQEGTWPAHILEHVTLELQNLAGMPGGFGKARETGLRGVYKVVVSAWQEDVTRACLDAALELLMAAINDTPFDLEATHTRLREVTRKHMLGPDAACIVAAATDKDRGIPAIRLSENDLVQLGYGSLQRRIWGSRVDRTGAIAEGITQNRELTFRLLESCGLPVMETDDSEVDPDVKTHRLLVVGGQLVAAALTGNADTATAADVTEHVHPETIASACLAARILGLKIAGVDILVKDIAHRLSDQGGVIAAVHADPALVMHFQPAASGPTPVGRAIVDHLFPGEHTGRIPVIGITGSSGTSEVAHLITELLRLSGKSPGLACSDGLFLDRRLIEGGNCANWRSGTRVLMNRSVKAAVLENGAEMILNEGLSYDRCQIGVVTRIEASEHFGRNYIQTPEQVFQIFRTQVDVVLRTGVAVLNAADPMVAEMAPLCDGEVIFFAMDPDLSAITQHRSRGGRAVLVRGNNLVLATPTEEAELVPLAEIPFVSDDPSCPRLERVLAAVAAAWALGIAHHIIRTGLETFSLDPADSSYLRTLGPSYSL